MNPSLISSPRKVDPLRTEVAIKICFADSAGILSPILFVIFREEKRAESTENSFSSLIFILLRPTKMCKLE